MKETPIDYEDPAYRAYVEDAFRKGVKIEWNFLPHHDLETRQWREVTNLSLILCWDSYLYRIAPKKPAPAAEEVDYFSQEYRLGLFKALINGQELEGECKNLPTKDGWIELATRHAASEIAEGKRKIRIKPQPAEPVTEVVPLEGKDWQDGPWEVCSDPDAPYPTIDLVVAYNHLDICTVTHGCQPILDRTRHEDAIELWRRKVGGQTWIACSKTVERKG